ncbi:MAG: hypothetical protein ACPL7B_12730, partial [Candidatus Poribacteria bacterium]
NVSTVAFGSEHSSAYNDRSATKFDILVSTDYNENSDHNSWKKVYEYDGDPVLTTREFSFDPIKARWVRIHIKESLGGNARIDEIEIYGDQIAKDEDLEKNDE